MDWIIILLIFIGVVSRSSKKKKQAQQRSQQQWQAAAEAISQAKAPRGKVPPKMREEITGLVKDVGKDILDNGLPTIREAVQEIRDSVPKKPAAPVNMPKPAPQAPMQPAGSIPYEAPMQAQRLETLRPEGETHEEHAAHIARIHAMEAAQTSAQTREDILRGMNLKKLRAAVVMSEVLGKPVALRPRGRL